MRRAILWLNDNGLVVLFVVGLSGLLLALMGFMFSDIQGPMSFHKWLVGEERFVLLASSGTGIGYGWNRAVRWAKRTPSPKKLAPIDPILEAARREVDAIAPEEP